MKLMVLDGNSLVNRAFFGIRMLNAPDGTPTNAVYGFLTILDRLLEEEHPDGLCVAFDLKAPTFRHLQYDGYKAQRHPMPEELAVQMPLLKQVLDTMGIARVELEGYEADDLLGTMCRIGGAQGHECVLVTGDKDSFQLISGQTTVLHVKTKMGNTETVRYTPEVFAAEYGFEPPKMVDLKALMGDASDNIPGVPGVGEKTALDLLHRFGSLDGVYAQLDSPEIREGVRKKLTAGQESARMSFALATIVTDAPLDFRPEDTRWTRSDRPGLYELFRRLGFARLIERYHLTPTAADAPQAEQPEMTCTLYELRTPEDVRTACAALRAPGDEPTFVYADGDFALTAFDRGTDCWVLDAASYEGDLNAALAALCAPEIPKVGHDIKALELALLRRGLSPEGWVFDTALAAYLLDASAGSYDLDTLCVKYGGFTLWHPQDDAPAQLSLLAEPQEDGRRRGVRQAEAAASAAAVGALWERLMPMLEETGVRALYEQTELPLAGELARMQLCGIRVDRARLTEYGREVQTHLEELGARVYALAGHEFNIASPRQLGQVLFEELGLRAGKKTKTGYSTDADTLDKLRGQHEIVPAVLEWRKWSKLAGTYVEGLGKCIAEDGRIHSTFHQMVTATGRLSSADPNLQNLPIRREDGSEIRRCFVPQEGWVLLDADYSQIELRILAALAEDEHMIEAFAGGQDIHAVTASQVFRVPLGEMTPQLRSRAKAVNFGIVYGISAFSLADDIGVSVREAQEYIDAYLGHYDGIRRYMDAQKQRAREQGWVATLYGRRRYLPELKSGNFNTRAFGERAAMNAPIQGTAADVMKRAMVAVGQELRARGMRTRLLLQVHDELLLEAPPEEAEQAAELLRRCMEQAAELRVALPVQVGRGENWYEAK